MDVGRFFPFIRLRIKSEYSENKVIVKKSECEWESFNLFWFDCFPQPWQ